MDTESAALGCARFLARIGSTPHHDAAPAPRSDRLARVAGCWHRFGALRAELAFATVE
jgi:hypothetical protein